MNSCWRETITALSTEAHYLQKHITKYGCYFVHRYAFSRVGNRPLVVTSAVSSFERAKTVRSSGWILWLVCWGIESIAMPFDLAKFTASNVLWLAWLSTVEEPFHFHLNENVFENVRATWQKCRNPSRRLAMHSPENQVDCPSSVFEPHAFLEMRMQVVCMCLLRSWRRLW